VSINHLTHKCCVYIKILKINETVDDLELELFGMENLSKPFPKNYFSLKVAHLHAP